MKTFSNIKFKGTFRDYQSKILRNANQYLKDGRVHIVAAPGSGKTILGLELIRGLNSPALVLSPSVTIRQQWGERFEENFIPDNLEKVGYLSYDLKNPALITSVTYQALHAAYSKINLKVTDDIDEDDVVLKESEQDFSEFNLIETIKSSGIRTICLDEAHHLRSEWQKALEGFLEELGNSVTVIALTATPPYDSSPNEWKRYNNLCGEIDEEIFVPQLVAQKTLCPHQDYIYFNYPTEKELSQLQGYYKNAVDCTNEIIKSEFLFKALQGSGVLSSYQQKEEVIYDNYEEFSTLIRILYKSGAKLPSNLLKLADIKGVIPEFDLSDCEKVFQFIIDKPDIFTEEISDELRSALSKYSLIEKRKVCLLSNEKLNKMLVSSSGKLNSIKDIVSSEYINLKSELRMLILTDFIKKDTLKAVGSDTEINTMGTVPIFEYIRRNCDSTLNLAVLSGTLVILPELTMSEIFKIADEKQVQYSATHIENTNYSTVSFSGSNKNKVSIITEAFQKGLINVLIGTKSLLGEGWDSPCINSLILASFVGSFMLSNQMRGRAIRIDKTNPQKASNIWHLVTVEPSELFNNKNNSDKEIISNDFDTVKRRFECFLAPAYSENVIENGIERIDILKPPYNKESYDRINNQMLALAANRESMKNRWSAVVNNNSTHLQVMEVCEIPKVVQPKGFTFKNKLMIVLLLILLIFIVAFTFIIPFVPNVVKVVLAIIEIAFLSVLIIKNLAKIIAFLSPENSIKTISSCILNTLKKIGTIQSMGANVVVVSDQTNGNIHCMLNNATAHEKQVFSDAVSEILSPIDNPRYIIVKGNNFTQSFSCPSVLGSKKEYAELLADYLKKKSDNFNVIYTRSDNGREQLLKAKKLSYININGVFVKNKKSVK